MPESIKEQVKNGAIGNLYLLYGEEPYLVAMNVGRLKKALLEPDDELMNFDLIEEGSDTDSIRASIETLPMMVERRVVLIRNAHIFEGGAAYTGLEKVFEDIPDTVTVIVQEEKVDKRSKVYKAIAKNGQVFELNRLEEGPLISWVAYLFRKAGVTVGRNEIAYLLSLTGNDMSRIESETGKLLSYVKEKGVCRREDIDAIVSPTIEARIFKMTDQLGAGRRADAYQSYRDLLAAGEPVQRIFFMIIRQFRLLVQTRSILDHRGSSQDVQKELGQIPFVADKLCRQASAFTFDKLKTIYNRLLEFDYQFKTSQTDPEAALDLFILDVAQLLKKR